MAKIAKKSDWGMFKPTLLVTHVVEYDVDSIDLAQEVAGKLAVSPHRKKG